MNESHVFLQESETNEMVEASLFDNVNEEHLAMWESSWVPAMRDYCENRALDDRPEDSHWDWKRKSGLWKQYLSYQPWAIVCRNELQGLMVTNDLARGRLNAQVGKPLVYVEFVATAPWNRVEIRKPPRFRGVGRVFILAAIEQSRESGFCGRVGLHSLPAAETFYEKKCGLTRMDSDEDHEGWSILK